MKQIQHFFEHCKDLEEGKWVRLDRWGEANEAKTILQEAIDRYQP